KLHERQTVLVCGMSLENTCQGQKQQNRTHANAFTFAVKRLGRDEKERSSKCTGLLLNVCLSYGGRGDIISACRNLATQASEGLLEVGSIDEDLVKKHLLTGDIPDPDVLIRTSGERRLSNFLMFQLAYAEFFFLEKHWPEVAHEDLLSVVAQFQKRHRRFGK
ncbi:unnamed protein product, partial [Effrenium voratum]